MSDICEICGKEFEKELQTIHYYQFTGGHNFCMSCIAERLIKKQMEKLGLEEKVKNEKVNENEKI